MSAPTPTIPVPSTTETATPQKAVSPATGPTLVDIVNVLADRAEPVIKLLDAAVKNYQNGQEREVRFQKHMSLIALAVVVFIVGAAATLTWKGKIDGSTFTFLLGLVVGYVLTFVRDQITGPG